MLFVNQLAKRGFAEGVFGTGLRISDYLPAGNPLEIGYGEFDWERGFDVEEYLRGVHNPTFKIPVHNQNGSLSCVGQAISMYASVKNYLETGIWVKLSARDLYSRIFVGFGGAYLEDGMMQGVNVGILPEHEVPSYDKGQPPSESFMRIKPMNSVSYDNLRYVVSGRDCRWLYPNIDEFAKAISLNCGLLMGVNGDNNGTWFTKEPVPPTNVIWSHAIYAAKAKLINGKKKIIFLNSWGEGVGDFGWQMIGEEWFETDNVFHGWVYDDIQNHLEQATEMEKIMEAIKLFEGKLPVSGYSIYHTDNWKFLCTKAGVTIPWGVFYDYAQSKKLREQYKI